MLIELFISFIRLGLTAFGGPAMVAYIKELAVEKKQWLDSKTFQDGVAIAQAIPGATAMQVAGYVGFKRAGVLGGIATFAGFGLPAFLLMLVLSLIYSKTHQIPQVLSIFEGLRVVVVAIVANAFLSFGKPLLKSKKEIAIGVLSFILFFLKVNPFLIISICFLLSILIFKDKAEEGSGIERESLKGIFMLLILLFIALMVLYFYDKTLFNLSLIMMKIDLFAFGGGYASLPLMLHEFVDRLALIDKKTFMDAIALGQITPGPIVITATFVGYYLKGFLGAVVATSSVFSPSFIMIAIGAKFQKTIRHSKIFLRAKRGVLASFSGLLLFAAIKFAHDVSWDFLKLLLCIVSFLALVRKVNILYVVTAASVISLFFFA